MVEIIKMAVSQEDDAIRVDRWFHRHYPYYSFLCVSKLARTGQLRVDGKRVKASERILAGQEIRFPQIISDLEQRVKSTPRANGTVANYDLTNDIVFMNNHIIAINKPAGLAVQGGNGILVSVDSLAGQMIFDADDKPKLVHRLDKDTSGILILARHIKAAQEMANIFQTKVALKKYMAILHGKVQNSKGIIRAPLERAEYGLENMVVSEGGKEAVTEYKVVKCNDLASLVEMTPITGRKHQIRAHAEHLGHPVIGDKRYGRASAAGSSAVANLCLHALSMKFELFGEKLYFEAPLPAHFKDAIAFFKL